MVKNQNIDDIDRKIMQLRALGFHQTDIASSMNISQSAVSQRIEKIRKQTINKDTDEIFWNLILGSGAYHLMKNLFKK